MNQRCWAAIIIIMCCNYSLRAATPPQVDESVKTAVAWLYSK